jgi:hypothetical protein
MQQFTQFSPVVHRLHELRHRNPRHASSPIDRKQPRWVLLPALELQIAPKRAGAVQRRSQRRSGEGERRHGCRGRAILGASPLSFAFSSIPGYLSPALRSTGIAPVAGFSIYLYKDVITFLNRFSFSYLRSSKIWQKVGSHLRERGWAGFCKHQANSQILEPMNVNVGIR